MTHPDLDQPVGEHPALAGCDCATWASKSVIDVLRDKNSRLIKAISEMADRNGVLTAQRDAAVNDADQLRADLAALTARVDNLHRRLA